MIIVWSMNKHFTTEQFNNFNSSVITVSGMIRVHMGILIEQQAKLGALAFKPKPRDPLEWTEDDGTINVETKKWVDRLMKYEANMKQVSDAIRKYNTDWTTMFL